MAWRAHRTQGAYGIAILAVSGAVLLRLATFGLLGPHHAFPTFYPAVVVATILGGLRGGLAATALAAACSAVFLPPAGRMWIGSREDFVAWCVFVVINLLLVAICEGFRRARVAEHEAREQAERAGRVKDEFLAMLSHELRTPMTSILGWTQLLQTPGITPADVEEGLAAIERNARAQNAIVSDLLDMTRITSGKIHLDLAPCPLAAVVDAAVQTLKPAADAKGVRLHRRAPDPPSAPRPIVHADGDRLQQVVWNLLSNAIKFTSPGGEVSVRVACEPRWARVIVTDTGAGIAPEFLPRVFEKFSQETGKASPRQPGLGLGLAIARDLVELHGGTITAASGGEGQGATFTVVLPVAATTSVIPPAPTPAPAPPALPPATVALPTVDAPASIPPASAASDDGLLAAAVTAAALAPLAAVTVSVPPAPAAPVIPATPATPAAG